MEGLHFPYSFPLSRHEIAKFGKALVCHAVLILNATLESSQTSNCEREKILPTYPKTWAKQTNKNTKDSW